MTKAIFIILTLAGFASGAEMEVTDRLSVDGSSLFKSTAVFSGSVGIGTTNPTSLLHVAGDADITGTLSAGTFSASTVSVNGSIITTGIQETGKTTGISITGKPLDYMEYSTDAAAQAAYVTNTAIIGNPSYHWLMNDNAANTTVVDAMGVADGASTRNTSAISAAGKINTALSFNGSGDYVSVGTLGNFGSMNLTASSFSCWVKTGATNTLMYLFGEVNNAGTFFGVALNSNESESMVPGKILVYLRSEDGNSMTAVTANATGITDNTWHNLVVTVNGSAKTATISVDGASLAVTYGSQAGNNIFVNFAYNFYLGARNLRGSPDSLFTGEIDDFRIYASILTAAQISAIYYGGSGTELQNPSLLQSYSEPNNKTQGNYSLKGIAAIRDSANKTLIKTFASPVNLSGANTVKFDVHSGRTGSNLKFGLHNYGSVDDAYTKLLIHFNGADGATAYTAETGQPVTFAGTAQLDTAIKKFAPSSLALNGNSDYVGVPASADWNFGTADFTVDLWIYATNEGAYGGANSGDLVDLTYPTLCFFTEYHRLKLVTSDINDYLGAETWSINSWHHVALVRSGGTFTGYIDGVHCSTSRTSQAAINGTALPLSIGYRSGSGNYFPGNIAELRISKGIARWTADFSASLPVMPYGLLTETAPYITSADAWQTIAWDLSGVNDANKNMLDSLIITPTNADLTNTFYLDNMYSPSGAANDIAFTTSGSERMRIDTSGNVGIGTSSPVTDLDVGGVGSIKIPVGTTAQRPANPAVGMMRFNTDINKLEMYNGTNWRLLTTASAFYCTGGTENTITAGGTDYKVHTFTMSGTLNCTGSGNVEVLLVAGGGGGGGTNNTGGQWGAGGGGAGGLIYNAAYAVSGSIAVSVGGGAAGATSWNNGSSGGDSAFGALSAAGGGYGGRGGYSSTAGAAGGNGGSGGGGGSDPSTLRVGGSGTSGQGNAGGNGACNQSGYAGGGGGAGGAGADGAASNNAAGGSGKSYSITGSDVTYAKGGMGGKTTSIGNAASNTGNGGDGPIGSVGSGYNGGNGGSGIVIVRYPL